MNANKPMTAARREELQQYCRTYRNSVGPIEVIREALASDALRADQVRRLRERLSVKHALSFSDGKCDADCSDCALLRETEAE